MSHILLRQCTTLVPIKTFKTWMMCVNDGCCARITRINTPVTIYLLLIILNLAAHLSHPDYFGTIGEILE